MRNRLIAKLFCSCRVKTRVDFQQVPNLLPPELFAEGILRILVVDDEQVIADTLTAILARSGFDAQTAYSGEQAVQMAADLPPDVLISDVGLRGMNGVEAAIRILGRAPGCRVILFSGQASTRDLLCDSRARGYQFEILNKPVHPRTLLECLPRTAVSTGMLSAMSAGF